MAMNFEELDDTTRGYMLQEFEAELRSSNPYVSKALSAKGRQAFPDLMRKAIRFGNEESLATDLAGPEYWEPIETYERGGVVRERKRNVRQAAERLALTEFNTWYVETVASLLRIPAVAGADWPTSSSDAERRESRSWTDQANTLRIPRKAFRG